MMSPRVWGDEWIQTRTREVKASSNGYTHEALLIEMRTLDATVQLIMLMARCDWKVDRSYEGWRYPADGCTVSPQMLRGTMERR
jgi:hypothetical protein